MYEGWDWGGWGLTLGLDGERWSGERVVRERQKLREGERERMARAERGGEMELGGSTDLMDYLLGNQALGVSGRWVSRDGSVCAVWLNYDEQMARADVGDGNRVLTRGAGVDEVRIYVVSNGAGTLGEGKEIGEQGQGPGGRQRALFRSERVGRAVVRKEDRRRTVGTELLEGGGVWGRRVEELWELRFGLRRELITKHAMRVVGGCFRMWGEGAKRREHLMLVHLLGGGMCDFAVSVWDVVSGKLVHVGVTEMEGDKGEFYWDEFEKKGLGGYKLKAMNTQTIVNLDMHVMYMAPGQVMVVWWEDGLFVFHVPEETGRAVVYRKCMTFYHWVLRGKNKLVSVEKDVSEMWMAVTVKAPNTWLHASRLQGNLKSFTCLFYQRHNGRFGHSREDDLRVLNRYCISTDVGLMQRYGAFDAVTDCLNYRSEIMPDGFDLKGRFSPMIPGLFVGVERFGANLSHIQCQYNYQTGFPETDFFISVHVREQIPEGMKECMDTYDVALFETAQQRLVLLYGGDQLVRLEFSKREEEVRVFFLERIVRMYFGRDRPGRAIQGPAQTPRQMGIRAALKNQPFEEGRVEGMDGLVMRLRKKRKGFRDLMQAVVISNSLFEWTDKRHALLARLAGPHERFVQLVFLLMCIRAKLESDRQMQMEIPRLPMAMWLSIISSIWDRRPEDEDEVRF